LLLGDYLAARALGLSTSRSSTHADAIGDPVPSGASVGELLALSDVAGRYPGTSLEAMLKGCIAGFTDDEAWLLGRRSELAELPINCNVLTKVSDEAILDRPLAPSRLAR
jgi:hypothetical protein